jgi:hypothetical protein
MSDPLVDLCRLQAEGYLRPPVRLGPGTLAGRPRPHSAHASPYPLNTLRLKAFLLYLRAVGTLSQMFGGHRRDGELTMRRERARPEAPAIDAPAARTRRRSAGPSTMMKASDTDLIANVDNHPAMAPGH